jgi:hypothetical protein
LPCKIEKQTVNHHNTLIMQGGGWLRNTDPAPEKGSEAKKKAPVNKCSKTSLPKQDN